MISGVNDPDRYVYVAKYVGMFQIFVLVTERFYDACHSSNNCFVWKS